MTKLERILLGSVVSVFVLLGFSLFYIQETKHAEASVSQGSDYQSTTTVQARTGVAIASPTVVGNTGLGGGTFGSVIITGANTGIINIYDATTTVNGGITQYATTTLATIPASTVAGTYTFDIHYRYGILIELQSGLMPTTTITYR